MQRIPLALYLGAIALITALVSAAFITHLHNGVAPSPMLELMLWLVGLFVLLASSRLAMALVNWLATLLMTPSALPRMDYSKEFQNQRALWWLYPPC